MQKRSSLLVLAYVCADVVRSLFAEALYVHSPKRHPFISFPLIVLLIEACKLSTAALIVLNSTRNFGIKGTQHFVIPAVLYGVNNFLYYWVLSRSSAGCVSLLLHARLPLTAIVHHFLLKKQECSRVWTSVVFVFAGVVLAQTDETFSVVDLPTVIVTSIMCFNSALATVVNERVLKTLDMTFWDQQVRIYVLGVLTSGIGLLSFSYQKGSVVVLVDSSEALSRTALCSAVGCIAFGALSGIFAGFVVYRLDSVVKVVSNAAITVLVTMGAFLLFGIFSFVPSHFIAGCVVLFASSYCYASASTLESKKSGATRGAQDKSTLPMLWKNGSYDKDGATTRSDGTNSKTRDVQGTIIAVSVAIALAVLFLWPGNARDLPHSFFSGKASDVFEREKLILVTYATSTNEAFCRTARSALVNGIALFVVGGGQGAGSLIEAQESKPQKYLDTLSEHERSFRKNQVLGFIDGFDVIVQQDSDAIIRTFDSFRTDVLYGAEKNCWPYVRAEVSRAEMCPLFPSNGEADAQYGGGLPVRYLNSGIMLCRARSCKTWFEKTFRVHPKHFERDDQAIAAETCLKHKDLCRIDFLSRVVQNTYMAFDDVVSENDTWKNNKTGSTPAFLHFNGDKGPFPVMDPYKSIAGAQLMERKIHFENMTTATYREVCSSYEL